jgi:hypothetical protein
VQRADRRENLVAAERLVAGGEVARHAEAELALGCPHRHVLGAQHGARRHQEALVQAADQRPVGPDVRLAARTGRCDLPARVRSGVRVERSLDRPAVVDGGGPAVRRQRGDRALLGPGRPQQVRRPFGGARVDRHRREPSQARTAAPYLR